MVPRFKDDKPIGTLKIAMMSRLEDLLKGMAQVPYVDYGKKL